MKEIVKKLRGLLKKNGAYAILINSTNEFLIEYNELSKNLRYKVTGFSGSTGDALLTLDKLYLFVDGRYHEQADIEVDKKNVTVVKLKMTEPYIKTLISKIKKNSVVLINASTISQQFLKSLESHLCAKKSKVELIDMKNIIQSSKSTYESKSIEIISVPDSISAKNADNKHHNFCCNLKDNEYTILTTIEDIAYLTNLRSFYIPYSSSFCAKAILSKKNAVIFCDLDLPNIGKKYRQMPLGSFSNELGEIQNSNIFINKKSINANDYNAINSSNNIFESDFSNLKTVKFDTEINHLKYAFTKTDDALTIIKDMIDSNKIYSELDFYNQLEQSFYQNEAIALSFKPIVAAGKNSSIIHYSHSSNDVYLEDGSLLLVDCGAYYNGGYATDITRTFIKGKPTIKQKQVYTTVLKAFFAAYHSSYTKESTWFDIDKKARSMINRFKINGFEFSHSTGHGVGLSVHESPPFVSPSSVSKTPVYKNAVFTIEPGIYKKNYGGVRLENTIYSDIINDKVKLTSFSKFPFEEKLVDFKMLTRKETGYFEKWQEQS